MKKFLFINLFFILIISFGVFNIVFALEEATSTSFILRTPINSDGGGNSTSTDFEIDYSIGQIAVGESTSTDFIIESGFLYFDETLTVNISGVDSGTTLEGVTTNITTNSTTIPFGSVISNASVIGAQKIEVTTDASYGYRVFINETQPLTKSGGAQIGTVDGTNASPSVWGLGTGLNSGYGYHSGDHSLSGGDVSRFSTDNTYASLDDVQREIIYSSEPVNSEITNMVFRIETNNLQPAGSYSSSIIYSITGSF
ncbi:MAG: hypothetical protein UT05_C0008G0006 [Parcubacteria group bacterium GW2011_GWF2_38_76]|nr:MAG: hypothetical protein UT05_C0008G0006 [Parcubacteria group bacterium GW2011_GWF2_38_76]HBM45738.1 hypothetical protein [Patescibacteria group bacterium]